MKKKYSLETQRVLDRYQELYEEDPELQAANADENGDITLLKRLFFEDKKLDILSLTETEFWNRLHLCNLLNPCPVEVVEFYIENGVPINAQDCYGMTPLHYAMRAENIDGAIALLNAGANPNIPNRDNLIPLRMCIPYPERLDLLELMLKNGGDVHYYNGQDYLIDGLKRFKGDNPEYSEFFKLLDKYT